MDTRLLQLLVCPVCKGPLADLRSEAGQELTCHADRLAFPVRDGIPVLLAGDATPGPNGLGVPASQQ